MLTQAAPSPTLPLQGQWTYDDYLRLPNDHNRYEIIDGTLYISPSPAYTHQYTVGEVLLQIANFLDQHKLGIVLPAPFEVHLSDKTRPVQPDVLFIANERKPESNAQVFKGAPDLVVEVISPSSLRLDQHIKFGAYEQAKVREYWLVDPKTRSVEVYSLPKEGPEYVLLGQFSNNEKMKSAVLDGLEIEVSSLFA
ncbi:MAG: Uma2 family endonuclease [Chloroflexi bacterium]|nr:Uma2 family endonuclease [Chloroflexota bacterium]